MATVPVVVGEERTLIEEVTWEKYEALVMSWEDGPKRLTYDRGRLEIMSPSLGHEQYSSLIGQMIELYTLEKQISRQSGRTTTFRRKAKRRGLEPDACYWIQNAARMRGKKEFDPATDPPPDLAIEVEITRSALDRMGIYGSLGVPEVWRFDGETLTIHLLQPDETYATSERSAALPDLLPADVMRFLQLSDQQDETTLMRGFRDWVRKGLRKPRKPPAKKSRPKKN